MSGEPDPVFGRFGYVRPPARRSEKSTGPNTQAAMNFAFRLRLLFGPGSRSEIMRVLLTLTEGPLDAARIADEAGFAKRNVNQALMALVESGALTAHSSRNERVFQAPRDRWATLMGTDPAEPDLPGFVSWVHLLPPLVETLLWLERETGRGDSEYIVASRARDLVERITPDIEVAGLRAPSVRSLAGAAYLPGFMELVDSMLAVIGSP